MGTKKKNPIVTAYCARCTKPIYAGKRASVVMTGTFTHEKTVEKEDARRYLHKECMGRLLESREEALERVMALAKETTKVVSTPPVDPEK